MKKIFLFALVFTIWVSLASAQEFRQGFSLGYQEDIAGIVTLDVEELNAQVPFSFGVFVGYSYQFDSGNAEDARKIFINDATGGTIQKFGSAIILGADFRYGLSTGSDTELRLFAGPRGVLYQAHYAFLGDNEDFDVRSNQAGAAGGIQALIPVSERIDLSLSAGVAYYLPATLEKGTGNSCTAPTGLMTTPGIPIPGKMRTGRSTSPAFHFRYFLVFAGSFERRRLLKLLITEAVSSSERISSTVKPPRRRS
jgi:hypothetical protein